MHRATGQTTSLRAFSAGGARATVDKMDNSSLMQTMAGNMMSNESRSGMEAPQNYGFTSHNHSADKGSDGKIIASAECAINFMGGSRSHPVCGAMDDRRHRLKGLAEGDSAMHRGNGDDMQIHLSKDGMFHSAPQMVRVQLVPAGSGKASPPARKGQAQSGSGTGSGSQAKEYMARRVSLTTEQLLQEKADQPTVGARAESGGAGAGSGGSANGGGQGAQDGHDKKTGQKSVAGAGADSTSYMHVKKDESAISGKQVKSLLDDKKTYHHVVSQKDYCGGEQGKDQFSKVLTLAGPAKNVYGCIG